MDLCIYLYICIYTHTQIHIHTPAYIPTYILRAYIHTDMRTCLCVCAIVLDGACFAFVTHIGSRLDRMHELINK